MSPVGQALKSGPEVTLQSEGRLTGVGHAEIRVRGRAVSVPSAQIDGRTVITTGKWLKIAAVQDEDLIEGKLLGEPASFVVHLQETGLNADIFTFPQRLGDGAPKYRYHLEWDNLAVIPITTFSDWWDKRVEPSVRRAVRKAAKAGVVVTPAELDEGFVRGVVSIYHETPVRQGKPFWHFQKSVEAVKRENSTYPERSMFLGAYYQGELIGFMRMIHTDGVASVIQFLTMMKHFEKRPANALIAKAVEVCQQRGYSHLVYCNYIYYDPKSSLTEFKRRNGFEPVLLPRYYVPLTLKGEVALRLGLHRGLAKRIPAPLVRQILKIRRLWYARRLTAAQGAL